MTDTMAVRAANNAFSHFPFCLRNAFGKGNVDLLVAIDVVKLKRGVMPFVTTIVASIHQLHATNELFNASRSVVSLLINSLPILRVSKSSLSPLLTLYRVIHPLRPSAILTTAGTESSTLSFRRKRRSANNAQAFNRVDVFPRWHDRLLSSMEAIIPHPCKPDIFAATYEAVEEAN